MFKTLLTTYFLIECKNKIVSLFLLNHWITMFMIRINTTSGSRFLNTVLLVLKYIVKMKFHRIDIKSNEIAEIFGVTEGTAREWIRDVRAAFNKNKKQKITIAEFCSYKGVPYKSIFCQINKMKFTDYDTQLLDGFIEEPKGILIMQKSD
ncbi:MAG: hypothetical protein CVU03_09295 [Bacteroidetes bacterium HGW-Bacteroidetes-2]|jgi:hypothetical protein|nr:MAG: hypothetical protein CVU03_09295 [Bacteroidetes bacterium HGW-Bacteroidetes-2]